MCNEQCMYCIWRRASVLGNYLLHNKYNVYNHAINDQNICCVLINYFINKRQVVQLFHRVIMFQTRSNYSGREVELGQQNKNKGQLSFGWSNIIDICFKYRWLYHAASLEFWLLSWKYIHGICKCNNIIIYRSEQILDMFRLANRMLVSIQRHAVQIPLWCYVTSAVFPLPCRLLR